MSRLSEPGVDEAEIRRTLAEWLLARWPEADRIELDPLRKPDEGASSETYFLFARISERGHERRESLVLRLEPGEHGIYPDAGVERQHQVLTQVAQTTNAPVPRVRWYEPDAEVLGASFFIMERVTGSLPGQMHHSHGLYTEVGPADREAMWISAVETLAEIHKAPTAAFSFLARPAGGASGLEQEVAHWDDYARWSGAALQPMQELARRWLDDHAPTHLTGLAWGDARPGNLIYRQNRCVAVLDWETASLGGAETDLGWWLFYDWFTSDGFGLPRLEGLGAADDFVALWEAKVGRKALDMEWHEVFATYRFSLIRDRALHVARLRGVEIPGMPPRDPILDRLERLCG